MPGVEAAQARVQADLPLRVGADKLLGRVVGFPSPASPLSTGSTCAAAPTCGAARRTAPWSRSTWPTPFTSPPGDGVTVDRRRRAGPGADPRRRLLA